MTSVIATVQGYNLKTQFIWKEFTVLHPGGHFEHYLFKPPSGIILTHGDMKTVRYTTEHLHGLNFYDGNVDYDQIDIILGNLKCVKHVYTYGNIAKCAISQYLPHGLITDVMDLGLIVPKHPLENTLCGRRHSSRYCSRWLSFQLYDFLNQ